MYRTTITTMDAALEVIASEAWIGGNLKFADASLEAVAAFAGAVRLRADFDPYLRRYLWRPRYGVMPAFIDIQVDTYAEGGNQVVGTTTATFTMVPERNRSFVARLAA